jgi:predicted metalloprotease with PDZ domain
MAAAMLGVVHPTPAVRSSSCIPGIAGSYTVAIDSATQTSARIDAFLRVPDGRLRMSTGASDHLPDHWATFVHDLSVTDARGKVIPLTRDTAAGWKLERLTDCARVRYTVDLTHAHSKWPPGNEQGAYQANNTLYTVTKALFIYAPVEGPRRVSLIVPRGWQVSVPWARSDGGYNAPSLESLVDNSLVVGYQHTFDVAVDSFTITVALVGDIVRDSALMRSSLQPPLRSYLQLFDTRLQGRYLVTVFYGDEDDGESFEQSSAFRTPGPLTEEGKILWANTFAHELFHFWNGGEISGADYATSQWFSEGFTEYYANRALARFQIISVADFLKLAAYHLGHYEYFRSAPAFDTVSVLHAGSRKTSYRFGVYDGGWAIAFWLDQLLRDETHDAKSLDDLMQLLHRDFGLAHRPYAYQDIVNAAGAIAGRSLEPEFARYVAGRDVLPVADLVRSVGLVDYARPYAAEYYLELDAHAAPPALARRRAMFGF